MNTNRTDETVYVNERVNTDTVEFVALMGGKMMLWVHGTTAEGYPGGVKTLLTKDEWESVKRAGDMVWKRLEGEG